MISVPARIRTRGYGAIDEVSTTVDVSRLGLLFITASPYYSRDMDVQVVFPYSQAANAIQAEQPGRVVRVTELSRGRRAVAIAIGQSAIDKRTSARAAPVLQEANKPLLHSAAKAPPSEPRPLVLVLDSETTVLENIRGLLTSQGYEVVAVNNARDGHEVLKLFTPVMVIAEIEGEGFPGYDLCAHAKSTPRLQRVPFVLTTKVANPSDYSAAHSLGAIACMAKPFKDERLVHLARLLAPLKSHASQS